MKKASQDGFSLIEILIGVGLLGFVALGALQVSRMLSQLQGSTDSNLDVIILKREMMDILQNGQYCTFSIAGNDPVGSPVIFNKVDHDDFDTEGLDVELWLTDITGTARTVKRFSSTDPAANTHGKILITKLQLVMNNPTIPANSNYPTGTFTDAGVIKLEIQKEGANKILRSSIPVSLSLTTDGSGNTTIDGCSNGTSNSNAPDEYLVIHSQSTTVPVCPAGWNSDSVGYSYVSSVLGGGASHSEDLGDRGSCLGIFGWMPFIECESNTCDYYTPNDFSMWLWAGAGSAPSRCNVCTKPGAYVRTLHSQTAITPTCPAGMTELWRGYSLLFLSMNQSMSAPMKLSSPGSCLRNFQNGLPFIECEAGACAHVTGQDHSAFLTSLVGSGDVGPSSPPNLSQIGRCIVCEGN